MVTVAIWVAVILAISAVLTAILAAAIERDELIEQGNESISFLRLTLTGLFGAVIGAAIAPATPTWWWTAIITSLLMAALILGSQLAARFMGHSNFGRSLAKVFSRPMKSLDLLFTPLAMPKQEQPDEFEQELLESVDEFGETIVREVMVPRIDMATVLADVPLSIALETFLASGYSRLPIIGKNVDDIVGVLYLKDVARILSKDPASLETITVSAKSRKPTFVPESMPVDDLLRQMQKSATHIAIVVDEYGGVAGLVTMEDVIEEIVGDIADEYDREVPEVEELEDGQLRVSAKFSLFDLGERFGLELEDEDVDTVGGMLSKLLGKLPAKDDSATFSGLTLKADRLEGRPKRLITVIVEPSQELLEAQAAFEGEN
ncbi:MAG: hemolysin family protein [Rhodoluna sp.]